MAKLEAPVVKAIMDKTVELFAPTRKGAWWKNTPSPFSPSGIPDITGTGTCEWKGRSIAIEVKKPDYRDNPMAGLSADQTKRLIWISSADGFACVTNRKPVPAGTYWALEVWVCETNESGQFEAWQHGWVYRGDFTVLAPEGLKPSQ